MVRATPNLDAVLDRTEQRQLHIRFDGRSIDVPLGDLDLGSQSSDETVRNAVSRYLNVPVQKLQTFAVTRPESGDLQMHPEAVFG